MSDTPTPLTSAGRPRRLGGNALLLAIPVLCALCCAIPLLAGSAALVVVSGWLAVHGLSVGALMLLLVGTVGLWVWRRRRRPSC